MMDFVNGWTLMNTLGEGAYGEVKLLVSKSDGQAIAMKIINLKEHPEAQENVLKETAILKHLNNPFIIKYFGKRTEESIGYIFLEYASGGELFDKIEPDIGMESWEAQKYMKQLTSGVEYLHTQGVVHRDLKPENLLLDEHDNLKITDFGMATLFRNQEGQERPLFKRCGTKPYMAPEVIINRKHKAEPIDIWSCGIVLVAMLAGELPWETALPECEEYSRWKEKDYTCHSPWTKLDNLALSLLRKILHPLPSARLSLAKIQQHRWCTKRYSQTRGPQQASTSAGERVASNNTSPPCHNDDIRMCQSQPETVAGAIYAISNDPGQQFCFSQPAQIDDMLVSTQYLATQSNNSQDSLQKLVRRMTRFFVSEGPEQAMESLVEVLRLLSLTCRCNAPNIITISTLDKHKNQLMFKASVLDMDKQTLLDFRLSKGCGLEFKRKFLEIKKRLNNIVVKGPVAWSIAVATNKVP